MTRFKAIMPLALLLAAEGCASPSQCSTKDGCKDVAAEGKSRPLPICLAAARISGPTMRTVGCDEALPFTEQHDSQASCCCR